MGLNTQKNTWLAMRVTQYYGSSSHDSAKYDQTESCVVFDTRMEAGAIAISLDDDYNSLAYESGGWELLNDGLDGFGDETVTVSEDEYAVSSGGTIHSVRSPMVTRTMHLAWRGPTVKAGSVFGTYVASTDRGSVRAYASYLLQGETTVRVYGRYSGGSTCYFDGYVSKWALSTENIYGQLELTVSVRCPSPDIVCSSLIAGDPEDGRFSPSIPAGSKGLSTNLKSFQWDLPASLNTGLLKAGHVTLSVGNDQAEVSSEQLVEAGFASGQYLRLYLGRSYPWSYHDAAMKFYSDSEYHTIVGQVSFPPGFWKVMRADSYVWARGVAGNGTDAKIVYPSNSDSYAVFDVTRRFF